MQKIKTGLTPKAQDPKMNWGEFQEGVFSGESVTLRHGTNAKGTNWCACTENKPGKTRPIFLGEQEVLANTFKYNPETGEIKFPEQFKLYVKDGELMKMEVMQLILVMMF